MTVYLQTAARAGVEAPMTEAERAARIELAAAYRIFDMLGWTEMIFNHITVRVPGPEVRFLINPLACIIARSRPPTSCSSTPKAAPCAKRSGL